MNVDSFQSNFAYTCQRHLWGECAAIAQEVLAAISKVRRQTLCPLTLCLQEFRCTQSQPAFDCQLQLDLTSISGTGERPIFKSLDVAAFTAGVFAIGCMALESSDLRSRLTSPEPTVGPRDSVSHKDGPGQFPLR